MMDNPRKLRNGPAVPCSLDPRRKARHLRETAVVASLEGPFGEKSLFSSYAAISQPVQGSRVLRVKHAPPTPWLRFNAILNVPG
jgi:hypothetical protein